MNESISILDSVEILPLSQEDINPFLTKVKIKVFHLGENRNHSFIDKDTALKMAKTLRGNPIVARYREEKEDFTDHGQEIVINDQGFNCLCMTKPYGFVDLNAKVWFEDFNDFDPDQNKVVTHTYLVTEGMVWTEQYKELQNTILDGGRPQSMELHEDTLQGEWSNKVNPYCDVFIINDAIITKLCALGDDVEPCFLGASITPEFKLDEEEGFVKELLELKHKFQYALNNNEGGLSMENLETPVVENVTPAVEAAPETNFSNEEGNVVETAALENENITGEFTKKEDPEENKEASDDKEKSDAAEAPKKEDEEKPADDKEEKEEEPKDDKEKKPEAKHSLHSDEDFEALQNSFNELQNKFASLEEENKKLIAFKQEIEDKQKDDLIASFYMLSDEDKKDVIANKAQYSLDKIKAELSIICVDKKVDFNLGKASEDTNATVVEAPVTYNLNAHEADTIPAWLKTVDAIHEKNK